MCGRICWRAAAASRNTIKLEVEASILTNSTVTTIAGGQVSLTALDRSEILSDTGGISVAVAAGTSGGSVAAGVGGGVSLNTISNTVKATIDSSTVQAAGVLSLTARSQKDPTSTSKYRIDALAFGVAAAGSGSAGAGLSGAFAGAGAAAINKVDNAVEASIRGSGGTRSVQALGGSVTVVASDDTSIRADAGGVALAAAAVAGAGTGAAAALGASYSENQIGKVTGHSVHAIIDSSNVTANGNVEVEATSTAVIATLSIGGSVAVSAGTGMASGAGAGAGALTINRIALDLESSIKNGSVVVANNNGDVEVHTTDSSEILADAGGVAVAVAVAVGTGTGGSGSGSIGGAYAENSIANKVRALIDTSTVLADGDVSLSAVSAKRVGSTSPYRIDAMALGIAASVTVTSTPGLTGAFAGAGSVALNRIDNTIEAIIRNSGGSQSVQAQHGGVSLNASDDSSIRADTGGFALALAVPTGTGGTGVAASLGASYSENQIGATGHAIRASVDGSRVSAAGQVEGTALSTATINTLAMGGSVAVTGGSSLTSVGVAGAAAATKNLIAAQLEASIQGGSVVTTSSGGDVVLSARDLSEIVADAGGVAVAVAASSQAGTTVSVAVGAGISLNTIANTVEVLIDGSTVEASGDLTLSAFAGTAPGTMVPFNLAQVNPGTDTIQRTGHGLKTGDHVVYHAASGAIGGLVDGQSYFVVRVDADHFQLVESRAESFKKTPKVINLTSSGAGFSHLLEKPRIRIDTLAIAGAGAGAGSGGGGTVLAATGAAAAVINNIDNMVEAVIKNSPRVLAQDITVQAQDASTIRADVGGVSLAIAGSAAAGTTVSVSVGASLAENHIGNARGQTVSARIENSTVTALTGSVSLDAQSRQEIGSFSIGGAISGAGSASGVVVGGAVAGTVSINTIDQTVESVIKNQSDVTAAQNVALTANDHSLVSADAGGVAASVAVGLAGISAAISLGLAISQNAIASDVLASIDTSKVTAQQSVDLDALSRSEINAYAFGGAGALSVSPTSVAGSGAAAGAFTTNTISNIIAAQITGSGGTRSVTAQLGAVSLDAQDDSRIQASSQGGSLAISVSATPGSPTIAVSLTGVTATNTISNQVRARVVDSTVRSTFGAVRLNAETLPSSNITSTAAAAAMSLAASGAISVAASGAGAGAYNTVTNTVEAVVLGTSTVQAQNGVTVLATNSAAIHAGTGAGALAVGLISASIGVSTNTNTITTTVTAKIDGSVATAGALLVKAASTARVDATSFATSFAAATAGAGSNVTTTVEENLTAVLGPNSTINAGNVTVQANASQEVTTLAKAATISGGLTVGVTRGSTTLKGTIGASVQGTVTPTGNVLVEAVESGHAFTETWSLAGGIAGLSGAGGESKTEISPTVNASIDGATIGTATQPISGDVHVRAIILSDGDAKSFGVSFSPTIAAAGTKSVVTLNPQVSSYLGDDADIRTTGSISVLALQNYRVDGNKLVADRRLSLAETESGSGTIVFSGAGADSTVNATPKLQSYVGTNAQALAGKDITLLALSFLETEAKAKSTVVGIVSVGQALTSATASGEVLAYVDGKVDAGEQANVLAVARHSALANAEGFVVGLGAAETISVSDVSPKVTASVGRNATTAELHARDASLIAISESQSRVTSKSNIDGAGKPDESRSKPEVTLRFGDGSSIFATNRNFQMLEDPNVVRPEMTVADLLRPNTVQVLENTGYVATLTPSAFETETPTFSLKNEGDSRLFSINSTTGDLLFRTVPDFENPGDRNADNLYEVPVVVTYAKGNVVNMNVRVQVTDVTGFLHAEVGPASTSGATVDVTDVTGLGAAAVTRWKATGLSASQATSLEQVVFQVDDLPTGQLAMVAGNVVTVDRDANGKGWFIDATPANDEEFGDLGARGYSAQVGPAAGLIDLLTVLLHEYGHVLGLAHAGSPTNLMFSALGVGTRRLPTAGQAEGVVPEPGVHHEVMYATGDNILSVSNLGTRYERVVANKESTDPGGSAPVTRVKAEAAPQLKIEIGSDALIQAGASEEVVIRVESNHTATALGVNPDALFLLGVVEAEAKVGGSIEVSIGGTIHHAGSLTLELHSANQAIAIGEALAVGPLGGTAVKTTATVEPTISTYVSPNSNIQVGGNFTIRTLAEDTALAISRGTSIGGGFAVGVGVAEATVKPKVSTYVAEGATIVAGGNITIETLHNIDSEGNSLDRGAKALAEASAGALVAGGGGASATASSTPEVSAYVDPGAKLTAGPNGTITVRAKTHHPALAQTGGMGFGLAGVGVSLASATSSGTTSAYMNGKVLGGRNLVVFAEAVDQALADTQAVSGGLLSGRGASSTTNVEPEVEAYLGANSETTVTGDVTVRANARPDGDARAVGFGGGAVDVGVSIAETTVKPQVLAYIGQDAKVTAGGNLGVFAEAGVPAPTLGDTFTPGTAVDPAEETIVFPDHGLDTGDVVLYDNQGNTSVGGLTSGQLYPVLRVDGDRIRLGANFDGALVNNTRDTIVFRDTHNLPNGTRVIYQTVGGAPAVGGLIEGAIYVVKVIDPTTIKLQDPSVVLAPATPFTSGDVGVDDKTITFTGHGLQPGQAVTYRGPKPIEFVSTVVDVKVRADGTLDQDFLFRDIIEEDNDAIYLGRDADNNGVIEGHGLASGELVRYQATPTIDVTGDGLLDGRPIGNLTSGTTYAVIAVNNFQVQLASLVDEVDAATAANKDNDRISVTGAYGTGDKIVYLAMGGNVIGGLVNRGVYYVRTFGPDSIKLYNDERDAFLDQNAIDITGPGTGQQRLYRQVELDPFKDTTADQRVVHSLARELDAGGLVDGQTYYVNRLSADQFQLETSPGAGALTLNLRGNGSSGQHTVGTEGVDLSATSGDHRLVVDLTSQPAGEHRLLGPGGISLRLNRSSTSDGISTATARGSSGKILGAEVNKAKATGSSTTQAYIAGNSSGTGGSVVAAAGNVVIQSTSKLNTSSQVNNGTGGFVAVGVSQATTDSDQANTAYVGENARVTAGQDFTLGALTTQAARSGAVAIGGGFIQVAVADATTDIDYTTDVQVGTNAQISAGGTLRVAGVSTTENTEAVANADARGFGAGTDANDGGRDGGRSVGDATGRGIHIGKTSARTETEIASGAKLTGQRVELSATMPTVNAQSISTAFAGGLGADSDATSRVENYQTTEVILRGNSEVTGTGGVVIQSTTTSTGTTSNAKATFRGAFGDTDSTAINDVGLTSKITTEADAVVRAGGSNPMALQVLTNAEATTPRQATSDRFGIDIGEAKTLGGTSRNTDVNWNADVVVLGASSPTLHIDQSGTIVEALGLTVNGGQATGTLSGADVVVDDIQASGGGQVLFDTHGGAIRGSGGAWTFNDTASGVTITNESDRRLVIQNINLLGAGTPTVELRGRSDGVSLEFEVKHVVVGSVIDIRNLGGSDLLLNNSLAINNPLGQVRIVNTGGSVLAANAATIIRASDIAIEAAGDVGSASQFLPVELVERLGQNERLNVQAGGDVHLDLTGRLRGPGSTMTVGVEALEAGRDLNVRLHQSLKDSLSTGPTGGTIQVTVPNEPYSQTVVQYFRPDPAGAAPATLDPAFFVDTSLAVAIDSTYSLDSLRAGRAIRLTGADLGPTARLVHVLGFTEITNPGVGGEIDVRTTGAIQLTHQGGRAMVVGQVESTQSSVDLLNPDQLTSGQDVQLLEGGWIKAATTARIRAGDDLTLAALSLVEAGTQVSLEGDALDIDTPGTTMSLRGTVRSPLVTLEGGNDVDTFLLYHANGINPGLAGSLVRVDGGGLRDYLLIDDSGDTGASPGSMTGTHVRGLGMGGDGVEYVGVDDLEVRLSQGGTSFDVHGTSATTKVLGGSGNDTVQVTSTSQTLTDIQGELTVDGVGGAANRLIVDHSGSSTSAIVTLTQDAILGLAPAAIYYMATGGHFISPGARNGIEIRGAGVGGNTFNIQSSLAGSTTQITGQGAQEVFKVFSDATGSGLGATITSKVDGIQGELSLVGGSGAGNRLILSNQGGATANTVVVTADQISGLAPATIYYSTASGGSFSHGTDWDGIRIIGANRGGNVVQVQSTLKDSTTTIESVGANATFQISSSATTTGQVDGIVGTLSLLAGSGGFNRLIVNDRGATSSKTNVVLGSSTIEGLAPATIHYSGVGQFNQNGSLDGILVMTSATASTSVSIIGTLAGSTTKVMTGLGNDVVEVGNVAGTLAEIQGTLTVDGGGHLTSPTTTLSRGSDSLTLASGDQVRFHDEGATSTGLEYTLTASTLTRTGVASMGYANVETVELKTGSQGVTVQVHRTADQVTTRVEGGVGNDLVIVSDTGVGSNLEVRTQGGADEVQVRGTGTGSFTVVEGGQGNDVLSVGTNAGIGGGSLDGVEGVVVMDGGEGSENRLILDNTAGTPSLNAVISANRITGMAPATIHYLATGGQFTSGASAEGILILGSNLGADRLIVTGTLAGSTTKVMTGSGNDQIEVGNEAGTLAEIQGTLTIDGEAHLASPTSTVSRGTDSLTLPNGDQVRFRDAGETVSGLAYTLTATTLTRTGVASIGYAHVETVEVFVTNQGATVQVDSTAADVTTRVEGGNGDDTVVVQDTGAGSIVEVRTQGGADAVELRRTGAGSFTVIDGGQGNDVLSVGTNAGVGGGSLDGVQGIVALDAGAGSGNRLVLDNSAGTPSINAEWTTPVVGQLGKITGLAPATLYYAATGGAFHTSSNEGVVLLASRLGANSVLLRGTHAGSSYQIVGGPLADAFYVGDTSVGNQGNLNLIRGTVAFVGNGGADTLEINDHGASGAFNYLIDPRQVRNDPATIRRTTGRTTPPARTFAPGGIRYNSTGDASRDSIVSLRIDGTDQANRFTVVPSQLTRILVNGNRPVSGVPTTGGGDSLRLDSSRFADKTGGRRLHLTGTGNGFWSFSDPGRTRSVFFESIERFNHVGIMASSADAGSPRQTVVVRDAETGAVRFAVLPYEPTYRGGYNVAVGDVNFDGLPDLITAAGPNHAPVIKIYSLRPDANGVYRGQLLTSFLAFNAAFRSGVSIAVGDVNGDGANDLVVGAGAGWVPQVKVFNGLTLRTTRSLIGTPFNAYAASFRGGVNVAVGDINQDGAADIVTTPATQGSPIVNIFSGRTRGLLRSFLGYAPTYQSGMHVTVGDFNGDAATDIVVTVGGRISPRVLVYSGATVFTPGQPQLLRTFIPGTPIVGRPVRVKAYALNGGDLDSERAFLVTDIVGTTLTFYYSLQPSDVFPRLPVIIRDGQVR
ncbi:MAG: hypothetical protein U0840_13595 [Gemmataceae bacterium]